MFSLFKKKNTVERVEKEIDKVIGKIHVKCSYGAKMSELNEVERTLYLNDIFAKEVELGGFSMLLFHPCAAYAKEMITTLERIDASKTAQLLKEALEKLPADYCEKSLEERQDLLEAADPQDTLFVELNEALSAMGENLQIYQNAYMLKHKEELK